MCLHHRQSPLGGPPGTGHIELKTSRRGTQHAVQVSLEGEGGKRVSRELLVDTGADFLVLPSSLLGALGIPADGLRPSEMQTANGKVQARIGSLPAIWLGQNRIENVRAAFLEDAKLGNSGLLGMSVLSRFTLTIDDKAGRLTLDTKGGARPGPAGRGSGRGGPGRGARYRAGSRTRARSGSVRAGAARRANSRGVPRGRRSGSGQIG